METRDEEEGEEKDFIIIYKAKSFRVNLHQDMFAVY